MHLLGVDRGWLYLALPDAVLPGVSEAFAALIDRRAAGEPVAYITGHREFMGLDFLVDPRALVPRPETEYLVEWALIHMRAWHDEPRLVVDVGTGSGAIAVSLAHDAHLGARTLVVGSDRSIDALQLARANRERLAASRVALVAGDLLTWCRGRIDLLVANLPYLREDQVHAGLRWEPTTALYAGERGFDLYRTLLPQAAALLAPDGALGCEIDPEQHDLALDLATRVYPEARVEIRRDLAGWERYLIVERVPGETPDAR